MAGSCSAFFVGWRLVVIFKRLSIFSYLKRILNLREEQKKMKANSVFERPQITIYGSECVGHQLMGAGGWEDVGVKV